jgi:hypothetical protein
MPTHPASLYEPTSCGATASDQTDLGSSPCPTPQRRHGRTAPAHPNFHRLRRGRAVANWSRTRDRRAWQRNSIGLRQLRIDSGDAVRALTYRRAGAQRSSIAALDASRSLDEPDRGGAAVSQLVTLESRLKGVPMAPVFRRSANLASKVTLLLQERPVLAASGRVRHPHRPRQPKAAAAVGA